MSREIYKRTIAPHNLRVGTDAGLGSYDVQAALLLMRDNLDLNPSIVISPHLFGYKNRVSGVNNYATKVYSINSPLRELGDDVVINGNFNTDTAWVKETGWSIADGVAKFNASTINSGIRQNNILVSGKTYRIKFIIRNTNSGTLAIRLYNYATTTTLAVYSSAGTYDTEFTSIDAGISFVALSTNTATLEIDSVSVREVLSTDLTQTTANSQPTLDKIAPSEQLSLKNSIGEARFLTHEPISFGATDKWTLEVNLKWFNDNGTNIILGDNTGNSGRDCLYLSIYPTAKIIYNNSAGASVDWGTTDYTLKKYVGKNINLSLVANGSSIELFIAGISCGTKTTTTSIKLNSLFSGYTSGLNFKGNYTFYQITPSALDANRIYYRASLLRSIFPEIPTVKIGSMDVAVRALEIVGTPAGNVIPNVTDNADWAALTTPAWCYHNNDAAVGSVYGKAYNGYSRDLIKTDLASSAFGYHIATKSEWTALLTDNVLNCKAMGTSYWTTANGTQITGLPLLGGASRNADGTFATIKGTVKFWCDDVDECVTINDNGTFSIDATDKKVGAYILLIKN